MPKILIRNPSVTNGDRQVRLVKTATSKATFTSLQGAMYDDEQEVRICLSPLDKVLFECTSFKSDSGTIMADGTFQVFVDNVDITDGYADLPTIKNLLEAYDLSMELIDTTEELVVPFHAKLNTETSDGAWIWLDSAYPETVITADNGAGDIISFTFEQYYTGEYGENMAFDPNWWWYETPGEYDIKFTFSHPVRTFQIGGIDEVVSWGSGIVRAFALGDTVLREVPNYLPDYVRSLDGIFNYAINFNSPNVVGWDVSRVTSFSYAFRRAESFNQDIGGWDVSNGLDFHRMFYGALIFNQDLSGWDMRKALGAESMFFEATAYTHDLSGWSVPNIINKPYDFSVESYMDPAPEHQLDYLRCQPHWGSTRGADLELYVIAGTLNIEMIQGETIDWGDGTSYTHVGTRAQIQHVYTQSCKVKLTVTTSAIIRRVNGDALKHVISWPLTSFAIGVSFIDAINLIDVPTNLPNYFTSIKDMFKGCTSFNSPSVSSWWTGNITDMSGAFEGCSLFNRQLTYWTPIKVTNMDRMFKDCTAYTITVAPWCVPLILEEPSEIFLNSGFNIANSPVWGTCPRGY